MRNGRTYREYKEFRERRPEQVDAHYLQACLAAIAAIGMMPKAVAVSRDAVRIAGLLRDAGVDVPVEVEPGAVGFLWIEVEPAPAIEPDEPDLGEADGQLSFFGGMYA